MKSPARRHRERMTAATAGDNPAATARASDQYQTMMAGLWTMRRDLKDMKSIERKVDYKRDHALPQLMDYVDGVITADAGGENEIVTNAMIWLFDIGDLDRGLAVADYVVAHGLDAPDRYERDAVTIVADEASDRVLDRLKAEPAPDADALAALDSQMAHVAQIIDGHDLHDQVSAKVLKAQGYVARDRGNAAGAVAYLKRALGLHDGIGVKKDIERLEREIKKAEADKSAPAQNDAGRG